MNTQAVHKRSKNQERRNKLFLQKFCGLVLIAMSILLLYMAINGTTLEERDATVVLMIAPIGLYLLFSKTVIVY